LRVRKAPPSPLAPHEEISLERKKDWQPRMATQQGFWRLEAARIRWLSHPGHSEASKQRELRSSVENRTLRKQLGLNDFR
jgi:hypothetical protein